MGWLVWEKKISCDIGLNSVDWTKVNQDNKSLSSGVYIIQVKGGNVDSTTKCILIK